MAGTQTSVTNHLRTWISREEQLKISSIVHSSGVSEATASSREGDAISVPVLSPSILDISMSPSRHCCSTVSLGSSKRIAHASDNARVEAHAQDHSIMSSSSSNMGFHPDQYGCPTAKRRFSDSGQDRSQMDCHPGWNLVLKRPVSQQCSWVSWRSMQSGGKVRGGSSTAQTELNDTGTSSNMQTSGAKPHLTNLEVSEPTATESDSNLTTPSPRRPVIIDIPGFDKKAYGDPTRRSSGQTARAPRESQPDLNAASITKLESAVLSETWVDPNADSTKPEANPQGPQTSTPLVASYLTSSHTPTTKSTKSFQAEYNTVVVEMKKDQEPRRVTNLSQMGSIKKSGSLPRPETFETLKQGSETPEQVIARLQEAGSREAFQRIKRKDHGDTSTTTALATLDLLRQPLPPQSDELEPKMTSIQTSAFPDLDLNLSLNQSLQAGGGSANASYTESKQERKAKRWSDMNNLNPSRWSNTGDSEEPESDNDSTKPMVRGFGRLIRSHRTPVPEDELAGWDGNFQPPPLDWEQRGQFYNNTPEYISGFDSWLGANTVRTMSQGPEVDFSALAPEEVQNLDNHADGIGFAPRETVIGKSNADRYGFKVADLTKPDPKNPPDFVSDAKLDLSDPDNARHKDETAQGLIDNRMERLRRELREAQANVLLQVSVEQEYKTVAEERVNHQEREPPPITSKNIYLRPAVSADIPGMRVILNWYIAQGIRPSELAEISEDDMHQRLEHSTSARLPFIVAVERNRKNSRSKSRKGLRVNPNHPIQNIDPEYIGVVKDEPIVGWASATDWSASDYIETITAELELYVAPSHRKAGVGRCLMDALLEATDRGYLKKGGYEFRVAPEMKHMYSAGGGRNLHKLIFQVRSFNNPMSPEQLDRIRGAAQGQPEPPFIKNGWVCRNGEGFGNRNNHTTVNSSYESARKQEKRKDYSKAARLNDREDDYETWLKEWLESLGFEEEAHLKKMGTKKGRFVDVRYLSRETCWQPADYRIPDFSQGL